MQLTLCDIYSWENNPRMKCLRRCFQFGIHSFMLSACVAINVDSMSPTVKYRRNEHWQLF